MVFLDSLRREWKAYLSPRLWILGVLLLVLFALAMVQYKWIDQVAQAERQRAKANLTTSLADFERDFDFEITRILVTFQVPAVNSTDFSERYKEWLRHAPYPKLIRGVYTLETSKAGPALREFCRPPMEGVRADWGRAEEGSDESPTVSLSILSQSTVGFSLNTSWNWRRKSLSYWRPRLLPPWLRAGFGDRIPPGYMLSSA